LNSYPERWRDRPCETLATVLVYSGSQVLNPAQFNNPVIEVGKDEMIGKLDRYKLKPLLKIFPGRIFGRGFFCFSILKSQIRVTYRPPE
jgi:hypothetical protein